MAVKCLKGTTGEGEKLYLLYFTVINNRTSGLMVAHKSALASIIREKRFLTKPRDSVMTYETFECQ